MSTIDEQGKDAILDALALIAICQRGDKDAYEAMISTYQGEGKDAERGMLLGAVIGHAVAILNAASEAMGIEPGKLLGAVRGSLKYADE